MQYISGLNLAGIFVRVWNARIVRPTVGCTAPWTHPGQRRVIICDGVGTHLGYDVGMKGIDLGLEILLRVLNLSLAM
jgi:hypothetical protein